MGLARNLLVLLLLAAWALAAHWASADPVSAHWHAALALAPLLLAWGLLVWQTPAPGALRGALLLLMLALLAWHWDGLRSHKTWLFYLEHVGSNLALALWFGRSLLAGREPVISGMARFIHQQPLSAQHARYTRCVTWVWALFFAAHALTSTLLFFWAPISTWSVYANLFTAPLIALLFALEMLVRKQVLPPEDRPSLSQILHAYRRQR